jgi:serine/threonine protein kinase
MGEVYRARDTRLERDVAIKVMPEHLSRQPDLRERFEREARAVSALNHPHICTLYDIGNHGDIEFLVMEFIEGETLGSRIAKGSLPWKLALKYAVEIADALDKAHCRGITHRDLKPGNIMLTSSGAKLLDFGLAKFRGDDSKRSSIATRTDVNPLTTAGYLVGTVQYMAPEQVEGKDVDSRTDIFALGSVLHEMISGQRVFKADSQPSLMAAILEHTPSSISSLVPAAPVSLDRIAHKCMAKDPDERWQSVRDLRDELKWVLESDREIQRARAHSRNWLGIAGWTVAVLSIIIGAILLPGGSHELTSLSPVAFFVNPSEVLAYAGASEIALSPNGHHLAFVAPGERGRKVLWIRDLDQPVAHPLPGTENAWYPFWSPDSKFIGFAAEGKLKKASLDERSVAIIADVPAFAQGAWGPGGTIVFGGSFSKGGLFRVSESGGQPQRLPQLDAGADDPVYLYPQFLPDGKHLLYFVNSGRKDKRGTYVRLWESGENEAQVLNTTHRVVFASPGYLLEIQGERIVAHPFDADRLRVTGDPLRIRGADDAGTTSRMYTSISVSDTSSILAYGGADRRPVELVWFDRRTLRREPLEVRLPADHRYTQIRLSPNEEWAALEVLDRKTNNYDIWLLELATRRLSKFTTGPGSERDPVFSPGGRWLGFTSDRNGSRDLFKKEIGGIEEVQVFPSQKDKYLETWAADADSVIFRINDGFDGIFRLVNGTPTQLLPPADFRRDEFSLSEDGKWVAFNTEESGNYEVMVASFPGLKSQRPVSIGGGAVPRWRKDGEEIFYLSMSGELMAAQIKKGDPPEVGIPQLLLRTRINVSGGRDQYAVSGDGQRFLLMETSELDPVPPITVTTNWNSLLVR